MAASIPEIMDDSLQRIRIKNWMEGQM
jgi:hypothetical protein